jgi:two-component system chemotaxis sensor kinase CheA
MVPQPDLNSQATTPAATEDTVKKGKTILIVEDDSILSRMYSEKFTFEGFNVVAAKDGAEALELVKSHHLDIILLDVMLPRMSGTDFLERLRQDEKNKNIPTIALTNLAEEDEKERCLKLGVKEYLVKAMQTPEEVVQKIKQYLN